jgi:hypothetical protein
MSDMEKSVALARTLVEQRYVKRGT